MLNILWVCVCHRFGFPGGSADRESTCNVGDLGSIPGLRRSPGEGNGYPLQYSALEKSMDWIVHGVAKSRTWLSDFHFQDAINYRWLYFWNKKHGQLNYDTWAVKCILIFKMLKCGWKISILELEIQYYLWHHAPSSVTGRQTCVQWPVKTS